MECERLIKLVKSWYLQVQDESLAPARMVSFMHKHVEECPLCIVDPEVEKDIDRITRIVFPPSKMTKLTKQDKEDEAVEEENETVSAEGEGNEGDEEEEEKYADDDDDDDYDDDDDMDDD